jgi:hypothetical protein
MLDCELFQGSRAVSQRRNGQFPFRPRDIDAVLLSGWAGQTPVRVDAVRGVPYTPTVCHAAPGASTAFQVCPDLQRH